MHHGSVVSPARGASISRRLRWSLAAALAAVAGSSSALAQTPAPLDAMGQVQTLLAEKATRTRAQRKLDSRLVLALKRRRGDAMFARLPRLATPLPVRSGDQTLIDLTGEVTPQLEAAIGRLGGQIVGSYPGWSELRAWVPVSRLEQLAEQPQVRRVRPAERAVAHVATQGDVAHRASIVRQAFPAIDGTGVKVCVLSDGVGTLGQVQAAGELPAVEIVGDRQGEVGTEGTAMLEIVHDIAPGSPLAFATAFGGQGAFANNIVGLRSSGCLVIVDDVGYAEESPFQDGIIARAVDMVAQSGALYFSSAGNGGGRLRGGTVWEGDFRGVPRALPGGRSILAHDFGGTTENVVLTDPDVFVLTWSEPFAAARSDYDLFLLEADGSNVVAASTGFQTSTGASFALEEIDSDERSDAGRRLVVALASGEPRVVRVDTFGDGRLQLATSGHIFGHAAALGADAVGAARVGPDPAITPFLGLERFSSDGPRRIFFTPGGTPLTPGNLLSSGGVVRMKPDFTAADGVSTSTPDSRFTTFFGTSAAAPHAAAIAALLKSAAPALPNDKLRFVLRSTALDIGAPGFDVDSGAGIVDAFDGLLLATSGVPCFDGIDNDGDGGADFPADPGCASLASRSEAPACSDGVDNDLDGKVDGADVNCTSPAGTTECGTGAAQSLAVLPLLAYFARRRRAPRPSA